MNIEYTHINSKDVVITDENGNVRMRRCITEEELVLENKVEILAKEMRRIDSKIYEKNNVDTFCNHLLIAQPVIIVLSSLLGLLVTGYSGVINTFGLNALVTGLASIFLVADKMRIEAVQTKLTREKDVVDLKRRKAQQDLELARKISELKENEYSSSKEYDGVTLSLYRKNIELLETLKDELYKECDYALNYNKDDLILLKKRKWSK